MLNPFFTSLSPLNYFFHHFFFIYIEFEGQKIKSAEGKDYALERSKPKLLIMKNSLNSEGIGIFKKSRQTNKQIFLRIEDVLGNI